MNVFSNICIFYNSIEIVTTKTSFRILRYGVTQSTSRTGNVYHFISEGSHCQIRLFNSTQKASLHLISDTFLQRPDNLVKMKNCLGVFFRFQKAKMMETSLTQLVQFCSQLIQHLHATISHKKERKL